MIVADVGKRGVKIHLLLYVTLPTTELSVILSLETSVSCRVVVLFDLLLRWVSTSFLLSADANVSFSCRLSATPFFYLLF